MDKNTVLGTNKRDMVATYLVAIAIGVMIALGV